MFPPMRTVFNKQTAAERTNFLNVVNDALLSGKAELDDAGVATFGKMDDAAVLKIDE